MDGIWFVSYITLWGLFLFLSVLIWVLYNQLGTIYLGDIEAATRDGLAEGAQAPVFSAQDPQGNVVEFLPASNRYTFLIFGSTECAMCEHILPELDKFITERSGEVGIVLVFKSTADRQDSLNEHYGTAIPIWTMDSDDVTKAYEVRVTPFGFLLDGEGVIRAKGVVNGGKHLDYLLDKAEAETKERGNEQLV